MIMKGKARRIVRMHISFNVLYIIALEDMYLYIHKYFDIMHFYQPSQTTICLQIFITDNDTT